MTDRERLIQILRVPIYPHELADPAEVVADYLIDNGVTFATDIKFGHWITHYASRGGKKRTLTWSECSECHVCGSPQWKVCPVCEAKMVSEVK